MAKIKLIKKIVLALMLTILVCGTIQMPVNAAKKVDVKVDKTETEKDRFVSPIANPDYYKTDQIGSSPKVSKMVATIVKWIRNVGAIVAVIVLIIIGFKYMFAGAADEKAQYKETLIPVVIGIVVLFGSIALISSIAKLVE